MTKISENYATLSDNLDLFYREAGTGDPMILIPGWTFSSDMFEHQISHFAKTHRVIAIDPRSQGRSSATLYGNNYVTHGKDLMDLITALNLKNVTLMGWSFGCLTSWEYIRRAGTDNIKALISIDLPFKSLSVNEGDWVEGPLDEIAGAVNGFLTSREGHRGFIDHYLTEVMVQRDLTDAEKSAIVGDSLRCQTPFAFSLLCAGMFSDYTEEAKLADANIPSLNVIAEHWQDIAVAHTNKHTPNTKTAVLGGHMMFWEHSDKFNAIVDDFLGS